MRLTEFTEAAQSKTDDNMRVYMALKAIEKKMNTLGIKGAQALEFLQTSLLDMALKAVGREKRAGYEPHVLNVKNWDDAKEFLMTAYRDGREQGVAEGDDGGRDKFYYQRNDIWRVMDGDELVHEYKPERYEVVGAKKLLARFDDEGYDVTHVISPMGTVTYLYGKPEEDMDEGYRVVPGYDREKYQERPGLEGPFHTKSGKVVYYDKKEGSYYDPDTDMFISYEDWQAMNEGWKDKLAAGALAATMALGAAGAHARVTPGQEQDPGINRLTGKPVATQVAPADQKPATQAPKGFSKEYLQGVVDGKHPRPMISVEKAQQLLKQMGESVTEAGFGRATGRASWDSNMPGYQGDYGGAENWGRREREDDEHHEIDRRQEQQAASGTWYITKDGKLVRDKEGQPYQFVGKAAATKAAQTMMAKPFNQGKKFMLTTKGA